MNRPWTAITRDAHALLRRRAILGAALATAVGLLVSYQPRTGEEIIGRADAGLLAALVVTSLVVASGVIHRHMRAAGALWLQKGGRPARLYLGRLAAAALAGTAVMLAPALVLTAVHGPPIEPAWTAATGVAAAVLTALIVFGWSGAGVGHDATAAVTTALVLAFLGVAPLPPTFEILRVGAGALRIPYVEVMDVTGWFFRAAPTPPPASVIRVVAHVLFWTALGAGGAEWWARRIGGFDRR